MSGQEWSDNKTQAIALAMKNYLIYILLAVVATLCSCSSDSPDNVEPRLLTLSATDITRTEATLSGRCSVADGVAMPRLWFSYGSDENMTAKADAADPTDGNVSHQRHSPVVGRDAQLHHSAQRPSNVRQCRSAEQRSDERDCRLQHS